jgi:hypothetical protein
VEKGEMEMESIAKPYKMTFKNYFFKVAFLMTIGFTYKGVISWFHSTYIVTAEEWTK